MFIDLFKKKIFFDIVLQKITNLEKLLINLGEKDVKNGDRPQERESRLTVKFEEESKISARTEQKSARLSKILNLAPKKAVF